MKDYFSPIKSHLFEEEEFGYGVRNLSWPEWHQWSVWKACFSFLGTHLWPSWTERRWECTFWWRLNFHFDHLQWTKCDISKDFSWSRCSAPDKTFVFIEVFLAEHVGILIFEHFVETILECSLGRVADQSWKPTLPYGAAAFFSNNQSKTTDQAFEFFRRHLERKTTMACKVLFYPKVTTPSLKHSRIHDHYFSREQQIFIKSFLPSPSQCRGERKTSYRTGKKKRSSALFFTLRLSLEGERNQQH